MAVAITAVFCAFGPLSLPAALAAKDAGAKVPAAKPTSSAPVEPAATPRSKRAEREAKAEAPVPAPTIAPPAPAEADESLGVARRHHPHTTPPGAAGVAPSGAAPGAAPRRSGHAPPAARERRRAEAGRDGGLTSAPDAQAGAAAGTESASSVEALARKTKKGGGKGPKKGKKKPLEEPVAEGSGGSKTPTKGKKGVRVAESASATAVAAAAVSPAAESGASAASAALVTPAPASVAPASALGAKQRGSAAAGARRGAAGASAGSASAIAPGVTTVAASSTVTPSGAASTGTARAAIKPAPRSASQPALVKTITKFVGVVPMPVRILIGVLIALALALGIRSRFSSVRTRRLVRQRGQLLEDVGLLQAALLPVPPARLGPVGTSVAYRPADGPGAGGDFYDVFALEDGQLAVIVGDVSGHGREALPHTALVRFTVRAYLEAGLSPRKALQTAGTVLERQLGDSFATVVAATYHPRERTLTYASAGHPPPVVLGDSPRPEQQHAARIEPVTSCSSPPIGTGMRTGARQTVVSVPGPARLCFHTDGVTEARVGEDLFGSQRLTRTLEALERDASAAALLDSITEQTDTRPDDMAACLLAVADGAGAPSIVLEQLELDRESLASGRAERFLRECRVSDADIAETLRSARLELERTDTVLLELHAEHERSIVSLGRDNVVHTAELVAASAS